MKIIKGVNNLMDSKTIVNYIIPIFGIVWAIVILVFLRPGGDVTTEVADSLISPVLVGAIGFSAPDEEGKYGPVRIVTGLVCITFGLLAWLIGKPLLAASLILTIGAELLGIGITSTLTKRKKKRIQS